MAHALTKDEYRSALRADHGTPRRFLAYCRCRLCDTPGNRRFATMLRNTGQVRMSGEGHCAQRILDPVESRADELGAERVAGPTIGRSYW